MQLTIQALGIVSFFVKGNSLSCLIGLICVNKILSHAPSQQISVSLHLNDNNNHMIVKRQYHVQNNSKVNKAHLDPMTASLPESA